MTIKGLIIALAITVYAQPISAVEFPTSLTKTEVAPEKNDALVSFAAGQLDMSEKTVAGGLGTIFKVAKDNLSKDNFSMLSSAVPNMDSYLEQAPTSSMSSLTSMLGTSDSAKKASSMEYLDSAFKKLGIPKESLPTMVDSISGYLSKGGYGDAANLLKKALSF